MAFKYESNVRKFTDKCSVMIGDHESEMFSVDLFHECTDNEINSPIEQMLYSALKTLAHVNFYEKADPVETKDGIFIVGFGIIPQCKIGDYRCDFQVYFGSHPREGKQEIYKQVFVECDSQQFHDRSEPERRYEKKRDRFIQLQGHKIFHFTGKEIMADPFNVAAEVISYVTGEDQTEIRDSLINLERD